MWSLVCAVWYNGVNFRKPFYCLVVNMARNSSQSQYNLCEHHKQYEFCGPSASLRKYYPASSWVERKKPGFRWTFSTA